MEPSDAASEPHTIPEWLRPLSERYLSTEAGPTPVAVKVATVCAAICALASAWLAVLLTLVALTDPLPVPTLLVAVALVTALLAPLFAVSIVAIPSRGWRRAPFWGALLLGFIALASLVPASFGEGTAVAMLSAVVVAAAAILLALELRRATADRWLAIKRHRSRSAG
jgi:hypothetical protein